MKGEENIYSNDENRHIKYQPSEIPCGIYHLYDNSYDYSEDQLVEDRYDLDEDNITEEEVKDSNYEESNVHKAEVIKKKDIEDLPAYKKISSCSITKEKEDKTLSTKEEVINKINDKNCPSGTYEVYYNVRYTVGIGAQITLTLNGDIQPSNQNSNLATDGEISGHAILTLASGDQISLLNNSIVALSLALNPNLGAQLTIKKLN